MGKTAGGAVWLHEELFSSFDYFQYFRNTSDEDVIRFLKIFTDLSAEEIQKYETYKFEELNQVKDVLAFEATKMRDGELVAAECLGHSKKLFTKNIDINSIDESITVKTTEGISLVDLMLQLKTCDSKSKAKSLITSGAVKINEEKILDINTKLTQSQFKDKFVLKIGKSAFFAIAII
jgi:tyrosyl-tRNA synthetase